MNIRAKIIVLMLSLTAMFALAVNAFALNIPVTSIGDGTYYEYPGSWHANSYSSTANPNSAHYNFFGTSDTFQRQTAYAQFELSPITTAGLDVASASLNFNLLDIHITGTYDAGTINHVANSSGATGNAGQMLGGSENVATILSQPLGWVSFDVTDYIKNDLLNGYGWSAFSFNSAATYYDYSNRYSGYSFASGESTDAPYLSISTGGGTTNGAVPEPTTMALFLSGLAGLGIFRKKKKI